MKSMKLTSNAFQHNGNIPEKYTCEGANVSPQLEISQVPENTKTLALIMDDPDAPAGTWDHWVLFNMPANTTSIPEGTEPQGIPGKNSWGKTGYGGPCPPDREHRYFFKLYALDAELDLHNGTAKSQLERSMQGHILTKTELIGKYNKKANR